MRPECAAACAPYRLVLPGTPLSGRLGERLGKATGSSLEFMDFRDYAPGDDLRHVDWRTFARTDQLKVRLYREEVAPVLEIVADSSASMEVTEGKKQARDDLVDAAAYWARRAAGHARTLDFPREPFRPNTLRLWITDFLDPADPGPVVRRFAAGAAHLYVVQLLDPWELDPDAEGPRTLIDCEEDVRLDLVLDKAAVARYRERLARLRTALERAVRAVAGTYCCVAADAPARMFSDGLLAQGVIEPA